VTRPYSNYVESGASWIGAIPQHWAITKLKYVTRLVNGAPFKPADWEERGTPIIRIENLNGGEEFNYTVEVLDAKFHVKKGDLLFAWSGNRGTSFGPYLWHKDGLYYLNQHIFRLEQFPFNKAWFYWALRAVTTYVESEAHGIIGLVHITKEDLGNIELPYIPIAEQNAIANYLDEKTRKIDALIEKKRRLIDLLKEQRTAIINQAVTKGITPNATMKDSGMDWIGVIPENWKIERLKFISHIKYGLGQPPPEMEGGIALIRATNVERGKIVEKDLLYVDPQEIPYDRDPILRERDIIVVRSGAYTGDSAIIPHEYDGAIAGYDMVIRVHGAVPHFVAYALLSPYVLNNQIDLCKLRAAQPHLNAEELGDTLIVVPSKTEQQTIVAYLKSESNRSSLLQQRYEKEIGLLQEFRAALISEVVTGKIDVRDYLVGESR
jgi:type I restriction enzyme S subunit